VPGGGMNFELTDDQELIRTSVAELASKFDDHYWMEKDQAHEFPAEFYRAIAGGGWLGMTIPEEYGGHGFGITEATLLAEEVARSGGGMNAASSIHMSIFGMHPVVVHGSDELKARTLPRVATGELHVCFGVTEPVPAWTRRGSRPSLAARATTMWSMADAVSSNELFIDDLEVPVEDRVGEEGKGFRYILDGLNPERMLIAAEALGLGRVALDKAVKYGNERIVFDRPIGMNQGIQFPLADSLARLDAAELMLRKATWLYDSGRPCGREANTAKYLCADPGFTAADRALQAHGGMGYSEEYHVSRYFREARLMKIAPVSQEMILNFLGSHVLGLPRSY
jgi:acyl-CoA dehydrogenase